MSKFTNDKCVLLSPETSELHSGHSVISLEAIHHVLVVVDEDVVGGEGHGHEEEAAAGDVHLLDAEDGVRQLHAPHLPTLHIEVNWLVAAAY